MARSLGTLCETSQFTRGMKPVMIIYAVNNTAHIFSVWSTSHPVAMISNANISWFRKMYLPIFLIIIPYYTAIISVWQMNT